MFQRPAQVNRSRITNRPREQQGAGAAGVLATIRVSKAGADRCWCAARTSNPLWGPTKVLGGFDSHALPPIYDMSEAGRPGKSRSTGSVSSRGAPSAVALEKDKGGLPPEAALVAPERRDQPSQGSRPRLTFSLNSPVSRRNPDGPPAREFTRKTLAADPCCKPRSRPGRFPRRRHKALSRSDL